MIEIMKHRFGSLLKIALLAASALLLTSGCANSANNPDPANSHSKFETCVKNYVDDSFTNGMTPNGGDPAEAAQGEAESVCSPLLN